ncbi:hypothetical protein H4W33_001820 [Kibdelosporangium phytohabitans]|nr:hypothetical protein [Kibdelosporangium phytohabitans]
MTTPIQTTERTTAADELPSPRTSAETEYEFEPTIVRGRE